MKSYNPGPWRKAVKIGVALLILLLLQFLFLAPSKGDSARFEFTSSLITPGGSPTVLPDGEVLLVSAPAGELYDPVSRTWSVTGNVVLSRGGCSATLLPNGEVLVAGGDHLFWSNATAELYDPASDKWTATGSLSWPRNSQTATMLPNGKVLIAGGSYDDPYGDHTWDSAELYDSASGTWTLTGKLITSRTSHTATLLPNGEVLVVGGVTNTGFVFGTLGSAELYDQTSELWTKAASLTTARSYHTATLLRTGKLLVAGGYGDTDFLTSCELYDPESDTWAPTGDLITARTNHTATLLPNGNVLVVGGFNKDGFLASSELYDPEKGTWTESASLNAARAYHAATLLPDSTVLITGGFDNSKTGVPLDSAELYVQSASLLNISTRLDVQTGDNVMIGGFIVIGTEAQTVIVRGLGPSLGVTGSLSDPMIELHDSTSALIASNDNWKDDSNQQHVIDSGLAPTNNSESALWLTLDPGAYTVVLRGKNEGTGVGLVEGYQVGQGGDAKLANISTRGLVRTGDNVLIGGVIVGAGTGDGTANVLVRALGPSLPLAGALGDPTLELHDGSGTIIDSNDNWKLRADGSSQKAEIEATTIPPGNDLESALLETLAPGNYTAIVRGKDNTVGVGMVEVYNLP